MRSPGVGGAGQERPGSASVASTRPELPAAPVLPSCVPPARRKPPGRGVVSPPGAPRPGAFWVTLCETGAKVGAGAGGHARARPPLPAPGSRRRPQDGLTGGEKKITRAGGGYELCG